MYGPRVLVPLALALAFLPLATARAGESAPTGRAATLPPITTGRAATLKPITADRATTPKSFRIGTGTLSPRREPTKGLGAATRERAASRKPVTVDRAAEQKPVTIDRAAEMKPVTVDRAAEMMPVAADRVAEMKPVTIDRAAGLMPVTDGRVAGLMGERAAGLREIAEGTLSAASLDRAAVPGMILTQDTLLANDILGGTDHPVFAWNDGYLLPYRARSLVRQGYFEESLYRTAATTVGYRRTCDGLSRTFQRYGWGRTRLVVGPGSGYWSMNRLDACGPHWYHRRTWGRPGWRDGLMGRRVGDFYFPLGYYLRPIRWGSLRYNKGYWPILVPWDCTEAVPEDFERTLRKSHFPMVMGDMAFKKGNYVQAALAFRDAIDRNEQSIAGCFAFGDALLALRNYQYAERSIRTGLAAAPTWADKLDRHGVYGVTGDLEKHLDEVEQFAKDYPNTPSAWFLLGYLRMTSGDVGRREQAVEAFEKLLELRPDDELGRRYLDRLRSERQEIDVDVEDAPTGEPALVKRDAPSK